jgi:hypothetical protein
VKVRMLFLPGEDGEWPTLLDAVDEYTEDTWGGTPDFYAESMTKHPLARELVVRVPDHAVIGLFAVPAVDAHIDGSEEA